MGAPRRPHPRLESRTRKGGVMRKAVLSLGAVAGAIAIVGTA